MFSRQESCYFSANCRGVNRIHSSYQILQEINGDIFKEAITLKMFSWASNVSTDLAPTLKNVFAYGGHVFTVLPMFGKSMEAVLHGSQETFPCPTVSVATIPRYGCSQKL